MRTLLALFLSLCLSVNAAVAAVIVVCDTFEHASGVELSVEQRGHFGHHEHHDDRDRADHAGGAGPDQDSERHAHAHVHPAFSPLAAGGPELPAVVGRFRPPLSPVAVLVSADPGRLERPPRAGLA